MSFEKELRLLKADTFDEYVEFVSRHLGFESAQTIPDGVGDLAVEEGVLSYAVSREARFAAFRWLKLASDCPAILESFFVVPQTKPARTALIQRLLPIKAPQDTDLPDGARPLVDGWRTVVGGERVEGSPVIPSFVELVALLSSQGRVTVNSEELLKRTRILESELEYARLSQAEMALELETARHNLRSTATAAKNTEDFETLIRPVFEEDSAGSGEPASEDDEILDALPVWAADNAERIVVLPRALSGAKKSQYQSPATIMKALEILAGPYRQHRIGEISLTDFEAALTAEGLQLAGSVGASIAGTAGDQYFVQWGKRRRFMDMHLLKGGGREPRYCMRIYFFWDSDTRRCVVGSLPAHLNNSLT
jgi:hypothetical protein